MTDCPSRLRGDLSKWMCEINTGVYIGQVSSRVRDLLWERVCKHIKNGRATMVYSTNNEQRLSFRTHHCVWEPVDFDGITLMRRPTAFAQQSDDTLKPGFSNAAKYRLAEKTRSAPSADSRDDYTVIDLETTGLQPSSDEILELGAVRVRGGKVQDTFSRLVITQTPVPKEILSLTGILSESLQVDSIPLATALQEFLAFIGHDTLLGYNLAFDMRFLSVACSRFGMAQPTNRCKDVMALARRKLRDVPNYKMETLIRHFSLGDACPHRALQDALLLHEIYVKLKRN